MMMVPNRLELLLVLLKYGRLVYINNNAFFSKCVSLHQSVAILVSGCLVFNVWRSVGLDSFLDDDFSLLSSLGNGFLFCGNVFRFPWAWSIVPHYQSFSCQMLVKGAVLALDFPADGCFAVSVVDHGAYKFLVFVKLVPGVCPSRFPSEFHSKRFFPCQRFLRSL